MNGKATLRALSVVLILCLSSALPIIKASVQKQRICVDPKDNIFYTGITPSGSSFNISAKAADWAHPGVYGYQMVLHYNNTLLEAVFAEYPKGHWLEPPFPVLDQPPPVIDQQRGTVTSAFAVLEGTGKTGGGTLFTVTFRIIQVPPQGENLSCSLELENVIMVNPNAEMIPSDQYDIVDGNYLISAAAPTIKEDLNHDGRVNILDMTIIALAFNSCPSDPRWNPKADVNGDGLVNIVDVAIIAKAWTW